MQAESLVIFLIIGGIAGFLAGKIVDGYGFGLVGNVVVGVVGSVVAGILLPRLGLFTGTDAVGQIISATVGAVALLIVAGFIRRVA